MDRWVIAETVDLLTGQRTFTSGYNTLAVTGDKNSIEWEVTLMANGVAADISGSTVIIYGIRPDKTTVLVNGTISGNICTTQLSQQFLALNGRVECLMILTNSNDNSTITVSHITLDVRSGPTDQIIDPGEILPNLSEGLVAIEQLSDFTLTRASVSDYVTVEMTNTGVYEVTYADGVSHILTANGGSLILN